MNYSCIGNIMRFSIKSLKDLKRFWHLSRCHREILSDVKYSSGIWIRIIEQNEDLDFLPLALILRDLVDQKLMSLPDYKCFIPCSEEFHSTIFDLYDGEDYYKHLMIVSARNNYYNLGKLVGQKITIDEEFRKELFFELVKCGKKGGDRSNFLSILGKPSFDIVRGVGSLACAKDFDIIKILIEKGYISRLHLEDYLFGWFKEDGSQVFEILDFLRSQNVPYKLGGRTAIGPWSSESWPFRPAGRISLPEYALFEDRKDILEGLHKYGYKFGEIFQDLGVYSEFHVKTFYDIIKLRKKSKAMENFLKPETAPEIFIKALKNNLNNVSDEKYYAQTIYEMRDLGLLKIRFMYKSKIPVGLIVEVEEKKIRIRFLKYQNRDFYSGIVDRIKPSDKDIKNYIRIGCRYKYPDVQRLLTQEN